MIQFANRPIEKLLKMIYMGSDMLETEKKIDEKSVLYPNDNSLLACFA